MKDQNQTINTYEEFWKNDPSDNKDISTYQAWNKELWSFKEIEKYIFEKIKTLNSVDLVEFGCGRGLAAVSFLNWIKNLSSNKIINSFTGIDGWDASSYINNIAEPNVNFIKSKLQDLHINNSQKWDIGYSVGVLHHVDELDKVIENISNTIKPKGLFLANFNIEFPFIRKNTDDALRKKLHQLSEIEQNKFIEEITILSSVLRTKDKLNVPNLPMIGIKEGEYFVNELINYFIFKMYYNPNLSMKRNITANVDWYKPSIVLGLDPKAVISLFKEFGLNYLTSFNPTPSSITICLIND